MAAEFKNDKQVKSRKRVSDHGEVFTSNREVNAMLDLVKQETERIDSKFLEPACGTGNFLTEILRRKLTVVDSYIKNQLEWERYAVDAISSIYGIDILPDNLNECRERLFLLFNEKYTKYFKKKCKEEFRTCVHFIINRNILCGDALTLKNENNQPIIFSDWRRPRNDSRIQRMDYIFEDLTPNSKQDLFNKPIISDTGTEAFIPKQVGGFPLTHFINLADAI